MNNRMHMNRSKELEKLLSIIARDPLNNTVECRQRLVFYLVGLEERIENLEKKRNANPEQ